MTFDPGVDFSKPLGLTEPMKKAIVIAVVFVLGLLLLVNISSLLVLS